MTTAAKLTIALSILGLVVVGTAYKSARSKRPPTTIAEAKAEPPTTTRNIHISAAAGMWLAIHGDELRILQDDMLVTVDDHGNVYNDDREGKSGKFIGMDGQSFREQLPGYFLIIEKMNRDEWTELVRTHPQNRHVQVVRALCQKNFPVEVFIDKGLVDAEDTAFGLPCLAFDQASLRNEPVSTAVPTEDETPTANKILKSCQAVSSFKTTADLFNDGTKFTVEPYECEAGTFLVVYRDASNACSMSLDGTTISSLETKSDEQHHEQVHIVGTFDSQPWIVNVAAQRKKIKLIPTNPEVPGDVIVNCER